MTSPPGADGEGPSREERALSTPDTTPAESSHCRTQGRAAASGGADRLDLTAVGRFALVAPPLPWATSRIHAARAAGPMPRYGSDSWTALPTRDVRRWAAVIAAAEAWRDYCSIERCELDLDAGEQEFVRRISTAAVDVSLAADWRAAASLPSNAELVAR